jgi:heme-degrading monooxygenase HmoA
MERGIPMSKYSRSIVLLVVAIFTVLIASILTPAPTNVSAQVAPAGSVARMWHGRVPAAKAEEYTIYINEAGLKQIRTIEGNLGLQMFRRAENDVAEFYVISYWKSRDAIRKFAGNDIEKASFLPRDREYLINPELQVKHFDVVVGK